MLNDTKITYLKNDSADAHPRTRRTSFTFDNSAQLSVKEWPIYQYWPQKSHIGRSLLYSKLFQYCVCWKKVLTFRAQLWHFNASMS